MNTILLSAAAAAACGAVVGLSAYAVPAITAPKAPLARSIAPGEGGLTDLARGRDGLPGDRAAYGRPRCDGSTADDIHDDDRDETSAARRAAGCGAKADGRDGPSLAGGIGGAGGLAGLGPDGGSGGRGGAGVNGGIGGRGGRGGASF